MPVKASPVLFISSLAGTDHEPHTPLKEKDSIPNEGIESFLSIG
jgi:hypothetical protein